MLVLARAVGERILIGPDIVVKIVRVEGDQVRVGIDAPREVRILRDDAKKRTPQEAGVR